MTRNHPQLFRAAGAASLALLLAAAWLAPSARSAGAAAAAQASESIFVRKLALKGNDIVHSPSTGQLYASVPSSEGAAGNSVAVIDPATGAVNSAVFIGSEPNRLALSGDGNTLYASLDGAYAVRRFDVATQTPGLQFAVGTDFFFGPLVVNDLAVAPGEPKVVAVVRYNRGASPPEAGVAVYDNGVRRTKTGLGHIDGSDFVAYSASASKLYGAGYYGGLRTMTIDGQGVTVEPGNTTFSVGARIKLDNGLVYSSTGQLINPAAKTLLGTFAGAST